MCFLMNLKFWMGEYDGIIKTLNFFIDLFADSVHFFFIRLLKGPKTINIDFNGKTVRNVDWIENLENKTCNKQ